MAKTSPSAPADKVARYEKLVATNPLVVRRGAALPYTSLNGNMFSVLTKSGTLALRLPAKERAAFLKQYKTQLTLQYGTAMPEYVDVPDALLKKTAELKKHFDVSFAYVSALRPKPTTKLKTVAK